MIMLNNPNNPLGKVSRCLRNMRSDVLKFNIELLSDNCQHVLIMCLLISGFIGGTGFVDLKTCFDDVGWLASASSVL